MHLKTPKYLITTESTLKSNSFLYIPFSWKPTVNMNLCNRQFLRENVASSYIFLVLHVGCSFRRSPSFSISSSIARKSELL